MNKEGIDVAIEYLKRKIEIAIEKRFRVALKHEGGKLVIKSGNCTTANDIIEYLIQEIAEKQLKLNILKLEKRGTSSEEKEKQPKLPLDKMKTL
jgi:transcriptional antiterminator Rof (Rho-off)